MKARTKRSTRPAVTAIFADPVLLSSDLREWAGERVPHAGHESALLGKVEALRLAGDGRSVEGKVRDQGPTPYRVSSVVCGNGTIRLAGTAAVRPNDVVCSYRLRKRAMPAK